MLDFFMVSTRSPKKDRIDIYPKFIIKKSADLMIRGGDFYAVWVEEKGLWSTDEHDALRLIDRELDIFAKNAKYPSDTHVKVLHMWDAESGMIDIWHKYCQRQLRDCFHPLDERLIFSNTPVSKDSYGSKRLPYPLEKGETPAYDELMSVLYSTEERHKIEWAIGAVVSGESVTLQKFFVLYGEAGTGKSTVLNIIQRLFDGYFCTFDAKALGSSSNAFALEAFHSNPLVAIQHDADLSHIEDNTRINSLVSHELMTVNEKFRSAYENRFNCLLFMGTNKPVKITDAKSGLIRRLIDISPSGKKLTLSRYEKAMSRIDFELGAIAEHCLEVYNAAPDYYDHYIPVTMLGASNDFYNFVLDAYYIFKKDDGITLKAAWEMYNAYCEEAKVTYPFSKRIFKEELKSYFRSYKERVGLDDGTRVRNYYEGFRSEKFECDIPDVEPPAEAPSGIIFSQCESALDRFCADCPAQYAGDNGAPTTKWCNVTTKLHDISTAEVHYVKPPENLIVIDFDISDESGEKSLDKNIEAASKFPPTYAEVSKSGKGVHLHYIYNGDVNALSRKYDEHVEIKIFTGGSALRRKLTLCNDIDISVISSGLPMKEVKKTVNFEGVKNEKALRTLIRKNLNKEICGATKPSVDLIFKDLESAYTNGIQYDVSDMYTAVLAFAANSTHQADYCIKKVKNMHFKSDYISEPADGSGDKLVFFDIEIFPNLFLVNWKFEGEGRAVVRMINPSAIEIENLMQYKLVGFNCRRYDNHLLYARLLGYSTEELYRLSQKIINEGKGYFGEAYNVSYTDVYDFSSKKQSLKKFEIELGIHHQELGLPWDKPVPEELWTKVAEYCDNDVIATEAVFNARKADFTARQILADVAGMTVNDTTNSLTTRIIFGKNRTPQGSFNYRNLAGDDCPFEPARDSVVAPFGYNVFDSRHRPVFPGYIFDKGKSTYRGEEVGEGGYVYAEPGIYEDVALLDVASMHPSSIVAENLFGDEYTARFNDILNIRIAIKHGDFDKARTMLGGKLAKYLTDENTANDLAKALKIAINSVYGLTAANFENPFRDIRNVDNIVAKRGALFMINLKHEVQARGYTVAHIKTDSIKIPNADKSIIDFVMALGKEYGYTFEHEATYDRMCLVNDAVYIARYADGKHAGEWAPTGTQFAVPYVFKTLFSKEPIIFSDLCETKSVSTALYLDMNEGLAEGEHNYIFIGKVGSFCPIKAGQGGGELLREGRGKNGEIIFSAANGSKGYRWLEAEMVQRLNKQGDIDISYYEALVDDAAKSISKYGDLDWFTDGDCPNFKNE